MMPRNDSVFRIETVSVLGCRDEFVFTVIAPKK